MRPWKKLQRQTYDILSHKYSLLIVTVALTTILVSIIQFGETLVLWSRDKYESVFSSFSDNVGRVSLQRQMCQEVPMDAVYTWVNGSDPELRRQLAEHRATLQLEASRRCPHAHCLPSVFAALHGSNALDESLSMGGELAGVVRNVTLARFSSPREAALAAASATTSISHAHWTSDASAADTIARGTLLLVGPRWGWGGTGADLEAALRWHFPEPGWTASLYPDHGVVALSWGWDQPRAAHLVAQSKEVSLLGIKFSVEQAHLILALPSAEHARDYSPSRFEDKDELRYSLRSLEQHAPWIRRVFLVTNGQIPHWLDLDAARLTLITHSQIFPHASHLPTFSSPAIESHLHRIPGLSTRFLYFNDDVFLGRQVWPEDFVTHAKGQKVYLSWGVPDCAAACPWAWVGDGSCDVACNSSACFFDNGDCSSSAWEHSRPRAHSAAQLAKVYQHNIGEEEPYQQEDNYPELNGDHVFEIKKHDHNESNPRLSYAEETKAPIELESIQTRSILQLDPNIPGFVRRSREKVSYSKTSSYRNGSDPNLVADDRLIRAVIVKRPPRGYLPRGSKHGSKFGSKHGSTSNESQPEQQAHLVAENQTQGAFAKDGSLGQGKESHNELAEKARDGEKGRKLEVLEWKMGLSRRQMERDRRNSIRGQEWSVQGPRPLGQASKLDTFASSLLHVNRLLNQEFGFGSRRVPAHMPHLVDSIVMRALQDRFPNEWLVTSSHRVRSATDMQFAFSYFYFLMSERANLTIPQIFESFDTDKSRSWSDREIRTLLTRLYELPLDHRRVLAFEHALLNCSEHVTLPQSALESMPVPPPYERYQDSTLPLVTEALVAACPPIVELLLEKFGSSPKYKFEIVRAQDVTFKMLSSNLSQLVTHLDDIRRDPKKFICLNDNLDPTRESDNAVARAVLQDFYESLFPNPSSFELPTELRNRFLHVSELNEWKAHRSRLRAAIFFCLLALVVFTAANFYQLECRTLQRKWCPKSRARVHPRTENV